MKGIARTIGKTRVPVDDELIAMLSMLDLAKGRLVAAWEIVLFVG